MAGRPRLAFKVGGSFYGHPIGTGRREAFRKAAALTMATVTVKR
jgi:hypothetical protein